MSVREALLALLVEGPKHGYQLKTEFDDATGNTWALNVGQVYTTLQRLERDGFVEPSGPGDGDGRITYLLTDAGRTELDQWLNTPTGTPVTSRDEASMRVLLSLSTGAAPVLSVVSAQRDAAMGTLQTLTAMKAEPPDQDNRSAAAEMAWRLQLDRMTFLAEAEIRWLEMAEARITKSGDGSTGPKKAEPKSQERTRRPS